MDKSCYNRGRAIIGVPLLARIFSIFLILHVLTYAACIYSRVALSCAHTQNWFLFIWLQTAVLTCFEIVVSIFPTVLLIFFNLSLIRKSEGGNLGAQKPCYNRGRAIIEGAIIEVILYAF